MKQIMGVFLLAACVAGGAERRVSPGVNLIVNPGFDAPDRHGWLARSEPITLDPNGPYQTPCLRVEWPRDDKYPDFYFICSDHIPAEPHRTYTFKCLVRTAHTAGTAQAGVRLVDAQGVSVGYRLAEKLEAGGRDWHEQRVQFTTHVRVATMQVYLIHRQLDGVVWYDECELVQVPPKPFPRIGTGEAVTFPGGPGALKMRVEDVAVRDGRITVRTTGAEVVIDPATGTVAGTQRVELRRPAVSVMFPEGLQGLRVLRHDPTVCVLSTGDLDIGVQCDSLVVVAAAQRQPVVCTGRIAGAWARYEGGHVLALDDHGGVGIYPHAIHGSGVAIDVPEPPKDLATAGWTCTHTVGAGLRLGIGIFPPREFDWEKSFKWRLCHTGNGFPPDHVLARWGEYATHMCLHASAMWKSVPPWIGPYEQRDPDDFRRVIGTCKRLGMTVIPYMSPWYYHVRDSGHFMAQLARQKAEFGFGGIYYDGLWFDDWIESYRVMRRTRELFREGCVYIHSTIGPPLFSKTMWCPFLDTYADLVLRGEGYAADGPNDPYVRYVAAGYRTSNAIGMMKGDKWQGTDAKQQKTIMLGYNGRGRWGTYPRRNEKGDYVWPGQLGPLTGLWVDWYFPELERLEREWRAGRWRR